MKSMLCAVAALGLMAPARAEETTDGRDERIRRLEETVMNLQKALGQVQEQLKDLKEAPPAAAPEAPPAPAPSVPLSAFASPFGSAPGRAFDFAVIGDFTASISDRGPQGQKASDRASFREAELAFGGNLDPYSRGDLIVAVADGEGAEVEEGYLTWLAPAGWLDRVQVGKMRSPFGKLNRIHRHDLPQSDYPRVMKRFFGDEGLSDTGISLSRILDNPWNVYSQLTYSLGNGENATAFDARNQLEPMHLARLATFFDVGKEGGLETGFSGAYGAQDRRERNLASYAGADLTYVWKRGKEKSFRFQNELVWGERQRFGFNADVTDIPQGDTQERKFGMVSFAEYQWARRWSGGVRYDYAQIPGSTVDKDKEWALSPYVTFYQSEFARLRLEFTHLERTGNHSVDNFFQNRDSNSVALQATFILGTHRPHAY